MVHYTRICDLSWSIDGRVLLATSIDVNDNEIILIDNPQPSTSKAPNQADKINKNQNYNDKPTILCSINIHQKSVNVCKFEPKSDLIASGSDDLSICIFKYEGLNEQKDSDKHNPFNDEFQIDNLEKWKTHVILRRRHVEDIVDLNWSPDEKYIVSGSIDNFSYVYKVETGEVLYELSKTHGYVQGVAWDPLGSYIVTLCADRYLRIFNANIDKNKSRKQTIAKIKTVEMTKDGNKFKTNLFYDDTLATISRRMSFSPNGELLICSFGIVEYDDSEEFINCTTLLCSKFVYFDEDKLGECYTGEPYKFENLKEVETNSSNTKKQTASTNKSTNDKKDENISNENLTAEENENLNKRIKYLGQPAKKPSQPLAPTR